MGLYPLLFYQPLSAGIAVSFYISTSINLYRPLRGHFLRSRRKPSVTGKAQGESTQRSALMANDWLHFDPVYFVYSTSIGSFGTTFSGLGESLRFIASTLGLLIGSRLDFIQVLSSNGVVCTQAYYASVTYGVWCARAPYAFRPREGILGKPLLLKFI